MIVLCTLECEYEICETFGGCKRSLPLLGQKVKDRQTVN